MIKLDAGQLFLHIGDHRIRRELHRLPLVIHSQQIADPSGNRERYRYQLLCVAVPGNISFHCFAKADRRHLGYIRCNSGGGVPQIGVREAHAHQLIKKCFRRKDAGVFHHRKAFHISDLSGQLRDLRILHPIGKQFVAQHAVIRTQGCVDGIQAHRYFHALRFIDRLAVRHVHTGFLQRGTAIRKCVFDHQILRLLGIGIRSDIGVLRSDDGLHILDAAVLQHFADAFARTRRNLIDHGPREGNARLILQIVDESGFHEALFFPGFRHFQHAFPELLPVLGYIVHGKERQRRFPVLIAFIQHGCDDAHRTDRFPGPFLYIRAHISEVLPVRAAKRIALLRDRK